MKFNKPEMRKPVRYYTKQWLVIWIIAALAGLFALPGLQQVWLINAWSIQYIRQALNPQADQAELADPPSGHARANFWLASYALQNGEPGRAERLIAERAAQGDPLAMTLMVKALLAQNKFTEAVVVGDQIGDAEFMRTIGSDAQTAGNHEAALLFFQAAWKMDVEIGTLSLADFLFYQKQDYATAETILRSALATFPNSRNWASWSNRLGDVLRTQQRWDEAEATYQATLTNSTDDWAAHIGLGWLFYERGDGWQEALNEFQFAVYNLESTGNAQLAIGQLLVCEQRYKEADSWYVQALVLNPEAQWWYLVRGNAAREGGDLALAQAVYQETIKLFPDFAYAYYELAYAHQLAEQPEQAKAAIEQAVLLIKPPNVYYYLRAGSIYEWGGEPARALESFHQALLLDPLNAAALAGIERLAP